MQGMTWHVAARHVCCDGRCVVFYEATQLGHAGGVGMCLWPKVSTCKGQDARAKGPRPVGRSGDIGCVHVVHGVSCMRCCPCRGSGALRTEGDGRQRDGAPQVEAHQPARLHARVCGNAWACIPGCISCVAA